MKKISFLVLLSVLFITACDDDEKEPALPGDVKDIQFIDTRSYTDWVYFSFSKGEVVTVTDYKNDLSWDIAFHRGDVRLNGGESGKGKGEGFNTQKTSWSAVTEAPTSGYIKDQVGKITTAFTGDGITEDDQPFSQTVTTWLTVDTSNPPPKYTVHNWIYVVKAADGNYVKLWLYDNKNEKNAAGYVSFRYQYNASGATNF
ncbi:HmuY family protein [Proteiniphilum sp.]|uniref:HmuY family protein n=1 Tax=Proteiniphilum sp. TaxID=1926877 RepID=UPI00331EC6A5